MHVEVSTQRSHHNQVHAFSTHWTMSVIVFVFRCVCYFSFLISYLIRFVFCCCWRRVVNNDDVVIGQRARMRCNNDNHNSTTKSYQYTKTNENKLKRSFSMSKICVVRWSRSVWCRHWHRHEQEWNRRKSRRSERMEVTFYFTLFQIVC